MRRPGRHELLFALLLACCGCQSVSYSITVRDSQHTAITIPGDAEIAKPIEVSPARSIEAEASDNQLEGVPSP